MRRGPPNSDIHAPAQMVPCTITFLEMMAPPPLPALVPPVPKLALLRAEKPPVSFYRYLYDVVGRPWLWTDRKRLSNRELIEIIHDDRVEIFVLYVRGCPAGYAEIDCRDGPDLHLQYFGLLPEFIGQGLGSYFLNWTIRHAWEKKPKRFWVNTNNFDHPRALPLYQRLGFVPYARREVHIDPDPDPLTPSDD